MNIYRKYRVWILTTATAASVAAYFLSNSVESKLARRRVESIMVPAIQDIRNEIIVGMDPILFYLAGVVRDSVGHITNATTETANRLRKELKLDEINFVDTNGVIRVSTHESQVGYWMGQDPDPTRAAGFLCLLTNHLWYTQPPRLTVKADDVYRKFAGIRMPGGALQVGLDFSRLTKDLKQRFAQVTADWHIGESGYYIIANRASGEVISDGSMSGIPDTYMEGVDQKPPTLIDLGFEPEMFWQEQKGSFNANVNGAPAICRTAVIPESGHRVCVVMPSREVTRTKNISVGTTMFLLLVVIVFVAAAALRTVTLRERAEELRLAEEERRRKDLALAASIQSASIPAVFPPFPHLAERIDLFGRMLAAKEVGGELYDFYFVSEKRIAVVIADVSGKGVPGAMFMMRAKTTLCDHLAAYGGNLAQIVADINAALADGNEANMFVTAWIGVIDIETGELDYVNCGHNPPLVKRADGSQEWLRTVSGIALAAFESAPYTQHQLVLHPGDMLFLYTDGVTEAQSKEGLYGEERLLAALENAGDRAETVCETVSASVAAFASGMPQADDITMLALVFNGAKRTFPATMEGLGEAATYLKGFWDSPKAAVILDEIVSNIVRCSGAATFDLTYMLHKGLHTLVFTDTGTAFNPLNHPDPDVTVPGEARKTGGLGIFMVKQMATSVNYKRVDDTNVLTVTVEG